MGLLEGQVKQQILVEIFMANKWDQSQGKMVVDENQEAFKIAIGKFASSIQY